MMLPDTHRWEQREKSPPPPYLGADDLWRKAGHGVGEPALQTFSKVANGLSEST